MGGVAGRGVAGARIKANETEARGDGEGLEGKSVSGSREAGRELLSPSLSCDLLSSKE